MFFLLKEVFGFGRDKCNMVGQKCVLLPFFVFAIANQYFLTYNLCEQ